MSVTPAEIVSLLNATTDDLSPRIGLIKQYWKHETHNIVGYFYYVKFRESRPTVDDLVEIASYRLVNFCIPRSRINEAIAEVQQNPLRMDSMTKLVNEARDFFIKTSAETGRRSGEFGEILLYMLIEWVLKAPIVACKMYLKTSKQMPVHGVDGIHMGYEGDKLILYWGESKIHQSLPSALSDIVSSVSKFLEDPDKHKNEVRLITHNLNIDIFSEEAKEALKNYFNPYKDESNRLSNRYACLAGFDINLYEQVSSFPDEECEITFCQLYEKEIERIGELITKKVIEANLHMHHFSYFLLPFPSVEDARKIFQKKLWGS